MRGSSHSQGLQEKAEAMLRLCRRNSQGTEDTLLEIADRARLAELDAQKEAILQKQAAEEEAAQQAFKNSTSMATATLDEIQRIFDRGVEIPVRYKLPDGGPQLPQAAPAVEGFARGTQGFRDFGAGTLAMLHGVEAVVRPGESTPGGAVSIVQHNDFSGAYIDSERTADTLVQKSLGALKRAIRNDQQGLRTLLVDVTA